MVDLVGDLRVVRRLVVFDFEDEDGFRFVLRRTAVCAVRLVLRRTLVELRLVGLRRVVVVLRRVVVGLRRVVAVLRVVGLRVLVLRVVFFLLFIMSQ